MVCTVISPHLLSYYKIFVYLGIIVKSASKSFSKGKRGFLLEVNHFTENKKLPQYRHIIEPVSLAVLGMYQFYHIRKRCGLAGNRNLKISEKLVGDFSKGKRCLLICNTVRD